MVVIKNVKPIENSIVAKRHTPQYQMHKYFARRPYNVFRNLVEHYSEPGDLVLDCFCGGGVTVFESLVLNRKTIGIDINPLATFITEMQIQQIDTENLKEYFNVFLNKVSYLKELYQVKIDDEIIEVDWYEWIYNVKCPNCDTLIQLNEENKISNGKYKCPNPECESNQGEKVGVQRIHCKPHSSTPVRLKYINKIGEKKEVYLTLEQQEELIKLQNVCIVPEGFESIDYDIPENWDRWYEDCLPEKGVNKFSDLFTKRNLYLNTMIFNEIIRLPEAQERDLLYFAFSSSLRYTNNMTRVTKNWENGNPTSMDKHAYWLPNVYVEQNVLHKLEDRMNAVIRGLDYTNTAIPNKKCKANDFDELKKSGDYLILTRSSSSTDFPDESIDVVITDPPYGSNVQYGELSSFWNIWYKKYKKMDDFIFNDEEAVVNRKSNFEGAKDIDFYGDMLEEIFTEMNRVLKPEGYLVFTFNNKNINVWLQMLKAVVNAGFYLPENGVIYQDFIKSYKNTSHLRFSGNIHGDFIYSFKKGLPEFNSPEYRVEDITAELSVNIINIIRRMYENEKRYTTTELYEKIYSSLVSLVIEYLYANLDEEAIEIERLSNSYIDSILNEYLFMENDYWYKK